MNPLRSIRLTPNDAEFLNQRFNNGDLYYDASQKTLVLYDGQVKGGIPLLRADLSNAVSGLGVAVDDIPPPNSRSGSLWFNTNSGVAVLVSISRLMILDRFWFSRNSLYF